MPLYDYSCRSCGCMKFEALVRAGASDIARRKSERGSPRSFSSTFTMSSLDHTKELVKAERRSACRSIRPNGTRSINTRFEHLDH